jgi:hypothetical protein
MRGLARVTFDNLGRVGVAPHPELQTLEGSLTRDKTEGVQGVHHAREALPCPGNNGNKRSFAVNGRRGCVYTDVVCYSIDNPFPLTNDKTETS